MATQYTLAGAGPDLLLFASSDPSFWGYFVVGTATSVAAQRYVFARATSLRRAKHFIRVLINSSPSAAQVGVALYWVPRVSPRLVYQVTGLRISGAQ